MSLFRSLQVVGAVLLLVSVGAVCSIAAEYTFTQIADTSGEISTFRFGQTNIDNFGNVAFRADLDNGVEGVFKGNGGQLSTIVLNEGRFAGYHFGNFALMNSVGTVAFGGNISATQDGVFVSSGGSLVTIAEVGPVFSSISLPRDINDAGQVTFEATTRAGIRGLYVGTGGPPTLIADTTGPFSDFNGGSTINDVGSVAFRAVLDNGIAGTYLSREGTITTIAEEIGPFIFVGTPVLQGHRILIPAKTAQNAFEEVLIPAGLQSFAADAPAGGSVSL